MYWCTSYEKVHILNWGVVLRCGFTGEVAVIFTEVKPVVVEPHIIKNTTTLPSPIPASPLAGPPPLTASPPRRWRRHRGAGTEVNFTHHGSIYRGPDAEPVSTDELRPNVVTADWRRMKENLKNNSENKAVLESVEKQLWWGLTRTSKKVSEEIFQGLIAQQVGVLWEEHRGRRPAHLDTLSVGRLVLELILVIFIPWRKRGFHLKTVWQHFILHPQFTK